MLDGTERVTDIFHYFSIESKVILCMLYCLLCCYGEKIIIEKCNYFLKGNLTFSVEMQLVFEESLTVASCGPLKENINSV